MNQKISGNRNAADQDEPAENTPPDEAESNDRFKKNMLAALAIRQENPLSGWDLLAKDVSIHEAERNRLIQEIPGLRAQAVNTMAYWMSLSERLAALERTRRLLARIPGSSGFSAKDLLDNTMMVKN